MHQHVRSLIVGMVLLALAVSVSPFPSHAQTDPVDLVSEDSLLAYLTDLTSIQPYSGWRNSASSGELEAIEYVQSTLEGMDHLLDLGMELEIQEFNVLISTEIWESELALTVNDSAIAVPADALRGPREDLAIALRFDSDGQFNDSEPNPVVAAGEVVVVRNGADLGEIASAKMYDKILLVDYALVDRATLPFNTALQNALILTHSAPAGIVLLTEFNNTVGESHGSFVGDVSIFNWVDAGPKPLLLYARLEDLASAGVNTWDDLALITAAEMTWDADVFSPGTSHNLIARIPGTNADQNMILGAHIDSPNSPGALDDGSGSAVNLEVARVLNTAEVQPPTDVYLVWFGSEELGLYGSAHFALTHQDLLDQTLGMFNSDCLGYPLDDLPTTLELVTWSYGRLGDGRLLWLDYLQDKAADLDIVVQPINAYYIESDSSAFAGFGVPHSNLIYANDALMNQIGGVHYATHLHDPYDRIELAAEQSAVFADMARLAVTAALHTGVDQPDLRVEPAAQARAVFLANQTEAVHMTPMVYTEMGMALLMAGLDVDVLPYGAALSADDLADAALVVALPPVDYPLPASGLDQYDVAWSEADAAILAEYVNAGGLLVITNSAHMMNFRNQPTLPNEDWADMNVLGAPFGIMFEEGRVPNSGFTPHGPHPLFTDLTGLSLFEDNGVPFTLSDGETLVSASDLNVIGRVAHGAGEVIVLADVGLLSAASTGEPINLPFWSNLGTYALTR